MKNKDILQRDRNDLNINLLFRKFNPYVQAIALNLCGNTAAAEDAVQDAWITVFTHGHQLRQTDSFLPWLKRIVVNSCHQLNRKEKRTVLVDELPDTYKMVQESVETKLKQLAKRDALHGILTELPLHLRETVILRYLTDYNSYDQIAAITGVPVGTVRSRLSDGKKSCQSCGIIQTISVHRHSKQINTGMHFIRRSVRNRSWIIPFTIANAWY